MIQCRSQSEKYKHILDKGQDMKMEELKYLFEVGVPFDIIKKALKMGHATLMDLIKFYKIEDRVRRK